MYPGTIEMAAKIRYEAWLAEDQHEQFGALDFVAPIGVWELPSAVRHRLCSLLMRAAQRVHGMDAITQEAPGPVTNRRIERE